MDRQMANALDNHIMGVHWEDGMDIVMWHVVEKDTGFIMETFEADQYDDAWNMCYYMNMDAREFYPPHFNPYTLMDSVEYADEWGGAMPESKRGINDTVYVVMGVDPTDMTWIEAAFNDYDEARNLCAHMNTKYEYLGTSYWVSPIRVLRYALDHSEFPDPDPDA